MSIIEIGINHTDKMDIEQEGRQGIKASHTTGVILWEKQVLRYYKIHIL